MKTSVSTRKFTAVTAAALFLAVTHESRADLITSFDFNDGTSQAALFSSDGGAQSSTITTNFPSANVTSFAGTTDNAVPGDLAGQALALQNGNPLNNGRYIQFSISTIDLEDFTISYSTRYSGTTAFTSQALSYSTGGTSFTNLGSATVSSTSFTTKTFNLSSVTAFEDLASVTFRLTFSGASATGTANNRIDNIQVTATPVPEPGTILGGLAVLGMIGSVRRRKAAR